MRDLRFTVRGQIIDKDPKCDFENIMKGTDNYLRLCFSFDSEWKDMVKVIQFKDRVGKEIISSIMRDNMAVVPISATQGPTFGFTLYGKRGNVVITTGTMLIKQL